MKQINQTLEDDLKQSEKRAKQHWYEDGLVETAVGVYFLLIGLLFFIESSIEGSITALGIPIITLGGIFAIAPIVRRLKTHITYPRTGFVSYKEPPASRRWLALGLGLAVGIGFGVLIAFLSLDGYFDEIRPSTEAANMFWLPLLQAVIFAGVFMYIAYRYELRRYYAIAVVALLAGAVVITAQLDDEMGMAVYFSILALAVIISGLITLRHFLRQTRPLNEES